MRYCSNIYKGRIFSVFRKNRKKIIANSAKICYTDLAVKRNGLMVKRLRRRPLTAETGVRFPVGLPTANKTNPDEKSGFVLFFSKDYFGIKIKLT